MQLLDVTAQRFLLFLFSLTPTITTSSRVSQCGSGMCDADGPVHPSMTIASYDIGDWPHYG